MADLLPNVYSKHFERLQACWTHLHASLPSPDYTAADVAEFTEHIEAHVDALMLGGGEGFSLLGEWLSCVMVHPNIQENGERAMISAERVVVLRCGDASIKMILRGNYVVSRFSGVNSIKRGSVQIN